MNAPVFRISWRRAGSFAGRLSPFGDGTHRLGVMVCWLAAAGSAAGVQGAVPILTSQIFLPDWHACSPRKMRLAPRGASNAIGQAAAIPSFSGI
jgi:hypothetical protein